MQTLIPQFYRCTSHIVVYMTDDFLCIAVYRVQMTQLGNIHSNSLLSYDINWKFIFYNSCFNHSYNTKANLI